MKTLEDTPTSALVAELCRRIDAGEKSARATTAIILSACQSECQESIIGSDRIGTAGTHARTIAAYLLRKKIGITWRGVAAILQADVSTIVLRCKRHRQKIASADASYLRAWSNISNRLAGL